MIYVFTKEAIESIQRNASEEWFDVMVAPPDGRWGVLSVDSPSVRYFIHKGCEKRAPRIVVFGGSDLGLERIPIDARREALRRILVLIQAYEKPPIRLPTAWSGYHRSNRHAFFACPFYQNALSLRWVAETGLLGTRDVVMWRLTASGEELSLTKYTPSLAGYEKAVAGWDTAYADVLERFGKVVAPAQPRPVHDTVDLEAVTYGPVNQGLRYSQWYDRLSAKQREFVDSKPIKAYKLRGIAGSGKTLTLAMKAIREAHAARERGEACRILFATHSWALAIQIDRLLYSLDEFDCASGIVTAPLVSIARELLPPEKVAPGARVLGDDSLEGRREQYERVRSIIGALRRSEWIRYRDKVGAAFRERVEAPEDSIGLKTLIWDLMNEFAVVFSAEHILPTVNAERQYLSLKRLGWMMKLSSDDEKRFVLRVYTEFVDQLVRDSALTVDQIINDFVSYLGTFGWNLRRTAEGYDLMFVDELHLFNEQERLVLNYLTRLPKEYPRIFMAIDPRQSAATVFTGETLPTRKTRETGVVRQLEDLGKLEEIALSEVHRFSPEILNLVKHINMMFPTVDLGPEYGLDLVQLDALAPKGRRPLVHQHRDSSEELRSAIEDVQAEAVNLAENSRAAVIVLDPGLLPALEAAAKEERLRSITLKSRDDIYELRFAKRSVVLSAAEYVAGLQFDRIVIAGFPETAVSGEGYHQRYFLSLLYLAVSRAVSFVSLHVNDSAGGLPAVLESAVSSGTVELCA